MNILIVVAGLGSGGTERVATKILNYLKYNDNKLTIITLSEGDEFFDVPQYVKKLNIPAKVNSKIISNLERIQEIKNVIKSHEIDCMISLGDTTNVVCIIAAIGCSCKTIISERSDPEIKIISIYWAVLRRVLYRFATLHVAQSLHAMNLVEKLFSVKRQVIIGNSYNLDCFIKSAESNYDKIIILSVGRLTKEKGYINMLNAISIIESQIKNYEYIIVGDGEQRKEIEDFIENKKLFNTVKLIGKVRDVGKYYHEANIFLFGSTHEGFPNVLVEAMAHGLPVISTKCSGGVEEVLADDVGIIVAQNNPIEMADAILDLISSKEKREMYSKKSINKSIEYRDSVISKKWIDAVESIL